MSTPRRLARGTGLTLGRLGVAMLGQIATVPVYLSHWDVSVYGSWLILQGFLGYLTLLSVAYQGYTHGEALQAGPEAGDTLRRIYRTALGTGYLIAALEFAAVAGIAPYALSVALAGESGAPPETLARLLVLFAALNLVLMPFGAITSQTMTIHGHYPRSAAWGLFHAVATIGAPALAVLLGADLFAAGLAQLGAHVVSASLSAADFARLARRHGLLAPVPVRWRAGLRGAVLSLPLAGRAFVDSFRQQGFRILLGAYAGPASVTELATTRTLANVLHQGIGTIHAPLLPELMRYVVRRDQERMEGAFAVVWLSLFLILVPALLVLCIVAEPVFAVWTRGEVAFDPLLFLVLLVAVLAHAAGQPAVAILQGHNRIAWMVGASLAAASGLGLSGVVLVPSLGLRGAGLALLAAELCAVAVSVTGARRTLRAAGLDFPMRSFRLVALAVASVFGLALLSQAAWPDAPWGLAVPLLVNLTLAARYWTTIPVFARARIRSALCTVLPRRVAVADARPGSTD